MVKIEEYLEQITDPSLRSKLQEAFVALKARQKFGLVFEEPIPESTSLHGLPIEKGTLVQDRRGTARGVHRVVEVKGEEAIVESATEGGEHQSISIRDLLVVKQFKEAIFPALKHVGSQTQGGAVRPHHAVINGENYHVLQLMQYLYRGQVDCIYIDPPYNTGSHDWTYNNRYVDDSDAWRHSNWLSMMEKRLRLAKKLLKHDGVLIVTIDEHEVHHLAMLLEKQFSNCRRQMVTIVNNAAGVSQGGFYRVEEYALFCFLGNSRPIPGDDDLLSGEKKPTPLWFSHIRYGGTNDVPSKRPGLVYPIAIDAQRLRIVGAGRTLAERVKDGDVVVRGKAELDRWIPDEDEELDGYPLVWPFRKSGAMATWQNQPHTLLDLAREGFVRVRNHPNGPGTNKWSVSYVKSGHRKKVLNGEIPIISREPDDGPYQLGKPKRDVVAKTVWKRKSHDAGKWGKRVLRELLGKTSFDYPKSPYAVRDALATVVGRNPDALIVDFFAGSGTTLHSTMMLNEQDGGNRRCILVTDNSVQESEARVLRTKGFYPGDVEYERAGIFESVTRPRIEAAISGKFASGKVLGASYLTGRDYAEGYAESADFFRLEYLSPDSIELGRQFDAIHPLLWLMAGGIGSCPEKPAGENDFTFPEGSTYGVLFNESRFRAFRARVKDRSDGLSHLWLVTNSNEAFAEMCAALPQGIRVSMLYRDYLRNFEINGRRVTR